MASRCTERGFRGALCIPIVPVILYFGFCVLRRAVRLDPLPIWLCFHQCPDHGRPPDGRGGRDNGLLAPELTTGITRVKGVASKGLGNWLSVQQAQELLNAPDAT